MRVWIGIAGFAGLSAVAMGAFAAHGLKHLLAPEQLQTLQIGVQYQLWHALALLLVVVLGQLQFGKGQFTHPLLGDAKHLVAPK